MDRFFEAQSVAVVGVSNSPTNLGRAMAYNLMEFGYEGCIYLVGPKGGAFLGHRIYPSVADLPEPVELATVLVPAKAVPSVLHQCGQRGVRRVVLQSAGFREAGKDRIELEGEVLNILKQYGMRMIGPNCIGIINRHTGLAVPFMPMKAEAPPGSIGIVSQSGGVGAMTINALGAEHLGFRAFASIGNKLDVDENDLLEYFLEDNKIHTAFAYLEGIADGRRLMEIGLRSPKPLVAIKSNRGRSGAAIAQSHSASLSSDDQVVDAALEQCGILRVYEQQQAVEKLKGFLLPEMKGNRLAVISRSGGHAVLAADAAEEFAFELPPFPEELTEAVREHSRAKVIQFHNPLDLGDLFDLPFYYALAEKTLEREDIDGLLFIHNYQGVFDAEDSRSLVRQLAGLAGRFQKPVALCVFTTRKELDFNRKQSSFPIFSDPREALRALAANRDRGARTSIPFAKERPEGADFNEASSILQALPAGPVPPRELALLLHSYGIPLVSWAHARSPEEAIESAERMGYPVALKTAQAEVIHKSDAGGVYLDLWNSEALAAAYRKLHALGPGVLIQKMAEPGLEWLAGGRQDRQFGPVVVAGLGGVYVEIFKETTIRVGPLAREEASRMLDRSKGKALLEGVRGQPPLDRQALEDLIVRISWLLHDFPQLTEIDLNPVRVYPEGCLALDWRARIVQENWKGA